MKSKDIAFLGILCLLFMAVSHTSMVIFDSLEDTSLSQYKWAKVFIAIVVSAAMEGAIAFYLRNGYMAEAGINSVFTAIVYLCCVKPYGLSEETYLGIAETVFGLSLGLNMYLYGRISAQQREDEEKENAEITVLKQQITLLETEKTQFKQWKTEAEQAKSAAETSINRLSAELQQCQTEAEQVKSDAEASINRLSTELQQWQTEAEQAKTALKQLQLSTTCECGYQADLKHHKAKCSHNNLVEQ